jgi:hypothetical protein
MTKLGGLNRYMQQAGEYMQRADGILSRGKNGKVGSMGGGQLMNYKPVIPNLYQGIWDKRKFANDFYDTLN